MIPPAQWRDFFLKPDGCKAGQIIYRQNLPLVDGGESISSYGGPVYEGMCFEHSVNRGYFAMIAIAVNAIAFLIGIIYSILKRDLSSGFTLAASMGVPVAVLSLIISLWKD